MVITTVLHVGQLELFSIGDSLTNFELASSTCESLFTEVNTYKWHKTSKSDVKVRCKIPMHERR